MTIKSEVTFMVYGQNGSGRIEKRIMEMTIQDFTACSGSNREKNSQLKSWAINLFPSAKDVKIQTVLRNG